MHITACPSIPEVKVTLEHHESASNETTNLPHGFSFDPSEGFKLDDPQHEVGRAKPMIMIYTYVSLTPMHIAHAKIDNKLLK